MNRPRSTWSIDPGFGDQYTLTIKQGLSSGTIVWLGELPECLELAAAYRKLGCVQDRSGENEPDGKAAK